MEKLNLKQVLNKQKYANAVKQRPFVLFVMVPLLLFTIYQVFLASPRYQSQSRLIVKEPDSMATMDASFALLSGFGMTNGNVDTELVKAFIQSNDMLTYLEDKLSVRVHFEGSHIDFFSRLGKDASQEDFLAFYNKHIKVEIDEKSQVITVYVQAFDQHFSYQMNREIVSRAEKYINEIGHYLAKEQLNFIQKEHAVIDNKLREAKSNLLSFQRQYNLLDPEAEGLALQQITYRLEAEVASKKAELSALRTSMSEDAPLVIQKTNQLRSLEIQLDNERGRLTQQKSLREKPLDDGRNLSVSEILSKFSEHKIDMELALNAYTSSQISLEKSRMEAYRQLKFLVTVETPTLPEEAKYPKVFYNISLFFVLNIMLFGMSRIIVATVIELRH